MIHLYMRNVTEQMNSEIAWPQKCFSMYIMQCTMVTLKSKAVIDNIFYDKLICGNITATNSDSIHQFLIAPHIFQYSPISKSNIQTYKRLVQYQQGEIYSWLLGNWLVKVIKYSEQ